MPGGAVSARPRGFRKKKIETLAKRHFAAGSNVVSDGPSCWTAVGVAGCHVSPKHAQRYLASFAWRFNRRYQLDTLTERLAYACARTAPHPYRVIIAG